jgi:hypothetical protein
MTDNEQSRAIDTDLLIGNMLHQTEAVVDFDEESLAQRKTSCSTGWQSQRRRSRNPVRTVRVRIGTPGGPKARALGSALSTTWPS